MTSSDDEKASFSPDSPVLQTGPPFTEEPGTGEKTTVKVPSAGVWATANGQQPRQGYPDCVYSHAAHIFQTAHVEKLLTHRVIRYAPTIQTHTEEASETVCEDNASTKSNTLWAFKLAFSTLKFQKLLEDVLMDSCFYTSQQMPEDLMSLVVVMLYDFQDRKFQPREPMVVKGEEPLEEVRRVENSLLSFKTKLAASLARCRIKQNLLSIDDILPKSLRQKHGRKHTLPLCAWVNTLQVSVEDVTETLRELGFVQVGPHTRLEGNVFCTDVHCSDVLMFPQKAEEKLKETSLLRDHALIIQTKSRSLVVSAVRPLLVKGADILIVGSYSAETVAHVAVHASANEAHVLVCGLLGHKEEMQSFLNTMGCKNVHFLSDQFTGLNEWDSRIQKVRVILLLPQCSASGLCNPVEHILSEDGDRDLLWDLSQGTISHSKLDSLVTKQMQNLRHALMFPKVNAVVYCTCSVYEEENELLVKRALENATVRPKQRPFRIVATGLEDEEEKFFRLEESDTVDGCFICLLKRDESEEPETVQDILTRAAAKGLLGGLLDLELPDQDKQRKKKKEKRKAAAPFPPLSPHQTDFLDTTRPPTDDSVPENLSDEYPTATDVHIRAGEVSGNTIKQTLNFTAEESSCSSRSSIFPDELSTTLNKNLMALNHGEVLSDQDSIDSSTTTPETNDQKRKSKSQRRTRRTKSKSISRSRTTKTHTSSPSRKKKPHKRRIRKQTHATSHIITSPDASTHPLMPAPPIGIQPNNLKPKTSPKELQKPPRRRRAELETQQEGVGSKPEALHLGGLVKVKQDFETSRQDVVGSARVVLPPISARTGPHQGLSSGLSSRLLQSSTSSSSTGSYLSSGLQLSTSRSVSRDSVHSGSTTCRSLSSRI